MGTRERRSEHDLGRVFCDLAVMAADGGRCVSDFAVLAGQPALFGSVASVSTARRVLLSIGEAELDRVRQARALARGRAWEAGAAPERVILDFDATPITIHSRQDIESDRRFPSPVSLLQSERRVVRARVAGPRHHGLDTTARARRRARHLRTQAPALPRPARRRTAHPPRPRHHATPPGRLGPWAGAILREFQRLQTLPAYG